MAITIKDIAHLAGVSHQAVSAAFKPASSSRVSAATRARILSIARELNYIPNAAARALSSSSSQTIGIIGSFFCNLQGSYLDEIAALFMLEGYHVLTSYCDARTNFRQAAAPLLSAGVNGILVMLPSKREDLDSTLPGPYVYCNDLPHDESDIYMDSATGYKLILEHLDFHGRKRIAFLEPQKFQTRRYYLETAAAHSNISSLDFLSLRDYNGSFTSVLTRLRQSKIDGVIASNDYVGAKFIKCCHDHHVGVPEEFAVIGYDGYTFTEFSPCSLTTLLLPVRQHAQAAATLLLQRIQDPQPHYPPAAIPIAPILHCGTSCGCKQPPLDRLFQTNTYPLLESDRRFNFLSDDL